ncbi:MAG: hypothetical protein IT580_02950 [Verrucomicrobiales bacterium]|nr:hypothetical protein [Verrucomicrobiales bacterium]
MRTLEHRSTRVARVGGWTAAITMVMILGVGTGRDAAEAQSASGGRFQLIGGAAGGGGRSAGADHVLVGAVVPLGSTAAVAAPVIPAEAYVVSGGLLGGPVPLSPAVRLSVQRVTDGTFELSWPDSAEGYVLESSPAVWPKTDWSPVVPQPVEKVLRIKPQDSVRYYRLRKG